MIQRSNDVGSFDDSLSEEESMAWLRERAPELAEFLISGKPCPSEDCSITSADLLLGYVINPAKGRPVQEIRDKVAASCAYFDILGHAAAGLEHNLPEHMGGFGLPENLGRPANPYSSGGAGGPF